jgi:ATP-dependent Clp protease ATP-binding subunit ClpC
MSAWSFLILAVLAIAIVAYRLGRTRGRDDALLARQMFGGAEEHQAARDGFPAEDDGERPALASGGTSAQAREAVRELVPELSPIVETLSTPDEILGNRIFQTGVERLSPLEPAELLDLFRGDRAIEAWMAAEALAQREAWEMAEESLISSLNDFVPWTRFFLCRALAAGRPADRPIVHRVLSGIDESWEYPTCRVVLQSFVAARLDAGETVDVATAFARVSDGQLRRADGLLAEARHDATQALCARMRAHRTGRVDLELLEHTGRVWTLEAVEERGAILEDPRLTETLDKAQESVLASPSRSMLLVGPSGVGKTAAIRSIARELIARGDILFEASTTDLIADKSYVGQLEGAIRNIVGALSGRPVVWYIPDLAALREAGRHRHSSISALNMLFPAVATGRVVILGEATPSGFDALVQAEPRVASAFRVHRVEPSDATTTLDLGRRWLRQEGVEADGDVLEDAALLATEFLAGRANPGALLDLLDAATERTAPGAAPRAARLVRDDLIVTIARLTGLPHSILDDRVDLDPDEIEEFFDMRVKGQPEAVRCLVDRIVMIKAGVTDPTRPQGVFLFAGPTGTGKTELAKTLAEYLFGSPDRLVRVDMSELQTPEHLDRLVGAPAIGSGESLAGKLRKQPFSVVLLDEFEKAHPRVWDLFLQVFDDGRLTDDTGREADFRHAIVVLTSNLGAAIPHGARVGFGHDRDGFQSAAVEREIGRAFRPELLNRLDRTVVFRPLSRETLRGILHSELERVFRRRGLRTRSWAVEWDEPAIDFLLERGYTEELGARPLKRAVERYLLAPLAETIVRHQAPHGDQFLFVRARRDRLVVEFVDPDAVDADEPVGLPSTDAADRRTIRDVALATDGSREDLALVVAALERVEARVAADAWAGIKERISAEMSSPEFWASDERFARLGVVEYQDRIEAGLRTARSVLGRISDSDRDRIAGHLLGRLALRTHLLEVAVRDVLEARPHDAFLSIDAAQESDEGRAWATRLSDMYAAWAATRNMRLDELDSSGAPATDTRRVWAVSGYGAHSLLAGEHGLHVLELPLDTGHSFQRIHARVRVVPQPPAPPRAEGETLASQAHSALHREGREESNIVRRYRESPSPLVRDASGWKTGLIDRVFAGNFDLFAVGDPQGAP